MAPTTATTFPSGLPSPMPTPPPLTTRQLSEDWVSRTRGLRIDRDRVSPTIEEEPTTTTAAPVVQDGDDIVSRGNWSYLGYADNYSSLHLLCAEYGG